jgi:Holliday junction resolvase RusA-like endonuclease
MKIVLPFLPISTNQAFATNFKTKRRFKSKDYAEFQRLVRVFVKPPCAIPSSMKLKAHIQITRNWLTKDKRIKRIDIANYEKTLIDTLSEILGFEDSQIFEINMKKIQCDLNREKTEVLIEAIDN